MYYTHICLLAQVMLNFSVATISNFACFYWQVRIGRCNFRGASISLLAKVKHCVFISPLDWVLEISILDSLLPVCDYDWWASPLRLTLPSQRVFNEMQASVCDCKSFASDSVQKLNK